MEVRLGFHLSHVNLMLIPEVHTLKLMMCNLKAAGVRPKASQKGT